MRAVILGYFMLCLFPACFWAIGLAEDPKPSPSPRVVSLETWFRELQSIGAKYRKGKTEVENKAAVNAFVEEIKASQEGKRVRFAAVLNNVTWKDGLATISFEIPTDKSTSPTAQMPLRISRFGDWQIKVDQKTALAFKPQMVFKFEGTVKFHPWKWGSVGPSANAQQLHSFSHDKLNTSYIGTFTTQDYEISINGKAYQGRWHKEK